MTFLPALAKIGSESLLSLYPIFVKKIGISMTLQMWTRLVAYVGMSMLFFDWAFVKKNIFSYDSIALALVNFSHIYFSYEGFRNLDSGVSFAIFNTYPLMILLLSGTMWDNAYFFVLLALAFFIYSNYAHSGDATHSHEAFPKTPDSAGSNIHTKDQDQNPNKNKYNESYMNLGHEIPSAKGDNPNFIYGLGMILLAALTEAFIYFLVHRVHTHNHWNHVFISYIFGAIAMTAYVFYENGGSWGQVVKQLDNVRVAAAAAINGIIGSVGYFLRFYASFRLETGTYSVLSYTGIIMSYVYGMLFDNEKLDIWKILGTLSIIASKALL